MLEHSVICVLSSSYLFFSAITANTWPSPSIGKLNATDGPFNGTLTLDQASWLGSLPGLGCMAGPILGGIFNQKFGRKRCMMMYAVPIVVSYFIMAYAKTIGLFYFARIMIGFSIGCLLSINPVYIGEMARNEHRGILTAILGIFDNSATLIPLIIGPFLSVKAFNLILGCLPLVFIVEFSIVGLESPYYYIQKNDRERAELVLRKMRKGSDEDIKMELKSLIRLIKGREHGSVFDIFKSRGMTRAMRMSLILLTFLNLSGPLAILTYSQQIFERAGSAFPAEYCAIITGVVSLLTSACTPFVVMFVGRKPMLMYSALATALGQILLGVFLSLSSYGVDTTSYNFLPLVLLIEIIIASGCGYLMIPYLLLSEIYPNTTKGIATGISESYSALMGFAVSKCFPLLSVSLGSGTVFIFFGFVSILATVYTHFCVIETKGKTLREILDEFDS